MFVPQFAAHLLPGPSPPPEPAPPAPPPDPRSLSHRAALRSLKCAECLTSSPHLDSSRREALRRFSVFPGLSAEHRAFAWRVMLGFSHAHADLRAHEARNRLHMYRHFLVAARAVAAAVAAPREEPPVVAAFRVYCAMYRYQDAVVVVPLRTPAPRALLPTLLSETDLACLDAMRSVLRTVYGEEGREEEEVQCDVFWALVGITGQQRRTAYSAAGQYLQTYGVRQKVMAYAKTLAVVDPELNHWIESRLQLSHSQYAEQWFRSLFSLPLASANRKDPTVLPRLWDALIASPFELICNVGVGLVRLVRHKIMDRNGGGRGRPLTSSEVLELLSNLPCVTAGSIELLLSDIWVNNSVSLFHRGRHIDEVRDNPRSYAPVEWPLLDEHAEADPRLIRTCQYLLRARGVGAFFFVVSIQSLQTSTIQRGGSHAFVRPCLPVALFVSDLVSYLRLVGCFRFCHFYCSAGWYLWSKNKTCVSFSLFEETRRAALQRSSGGLEPLHDCTNETLFSSFRSLYIYIYTYIRFCWSEGFGSCARRWLVRKAREY